MTEREAPIVSFYGEYRFLSNFFPAPVVLDEETYPTVEHGFQAAKTLLLGQRKEIRLAPSAGAAKRMGRRVVLRADWNATRIAVMRDLVRQKFKAEGPLAPRLLATGNALLVEGNHWHDTFWGQCPLGSGDNWLGKILMEIREEIR